jgi:hypothetical protein
MENDNSYPQLRALLQKQIATSNLRSPRDLVQSRPLLVRSSQNKGLLTYFNVAGKARAGDSFY